MVPRKEPVSLSSCSMTALPWVTTVTTRGSSSAATAANVMIRVHFKAPLQLRLDREVSSSIIEGVNSASIRFGKECRARSRRQAGREVLSWPWHTLYPTKGRTIPDALQPRQQQGSQMEMILGIKIRARSLGGSSGTAPPHQQVLMWQGKTNAASLISWSTSGSMYMYVSHLTFQ